MSLPYSEATSGKGAIEAMHKILEQFGCQRFGTMTDEEHGELIVQFTYRGRNVTVKASYKGYAAALLKEKPFNPGRHRMTRQQYEERALKQARTSVNSVLRDWVKGQVTAVETGMLSFEGAFLGQILLPSGRTVLEEVTKRESPLLPYIAEAA